MNLNSIGQQIKAARDRLDWNQVLLAEKIGVWPARLSQLENDRRLPSEAEWERLCQSLGLSPDDGPERRRALPFPEQDWRVPPPEQQLCPDRPVPARIHAARKSFGAIVDERLRQVESRADAGISAKFLHQAMLESGHEAMFWLQVLATGGKACWYAPLRAGFRAHPIVDRDLKQTLGDVRVPSVELSEPSLLLFPQLTLATRRAHYRLDALVCARATRTWLDVEVDGGGHDSEWDGQRQRHLGLPTIRLSRSEIGARDMLGILGQKLEPWTLPKAS